MTSTSPTKITIGGSRTEPFKSRAWSPHIYHLLILNSFDLCFPVWWHIFAWAFPVIQARKQVAPGRRNRPHESIKWCQYTSERRGTPICSYLLHWAFAVANRGGEDQHRIGHKSDINRRSMPAVLKSIQLISLHSLHTRLNSTNTISEKVL